ncbi:TIM44-like domain-containing protein [Sphingobium sp. CFD-2]|uniref:Tim44 domain-containing protein n=1 Tax=Sphingobium sp. CFD-2 TaxID=2878542 RepID=UPI00214AD9AF|nr:TIM44-like domain-containing protein [Sphingobium sp. CFD-2]
MIGTKYRFTGTIAMGLAVAVMLASPADARRGGSLGSRGARTTQAPPPTRTAPNETAPVQRTMTDKQAPSPGQAANSRPAAAAPGKMGGLAKGLIGGLVAGGLLGMLLGNGLGALAGSGMLMALLQIALLGALAWFALRLFRRRPALAGAGGPTATAFAANPFAGPFQGNSTAPMGAFSPAPAPSGEIAITTSDQQCFERLLTEVQEAFGREDYARLRACTTAEVMSYLAEELSSNATRGQRNEVYGTELLDAEVAEAWNEGGTDYATIAMRYQSIDIMRDRQSGAVLAGNPDLPTTTTELWTFVRDARTSWRLSAIQEA